MSIGVVVIPRSTISLKAFQNIFAAKRKTPQKSLSQESFYFPSKLVMVFMCP